MSTRLEIIFQQAATPARHPGESREMDPGIARGSAEENHAAADAALAWIPAFAGMTEWSHAATTLEPRPCARS